MRVAVYHSNSDIRVEDRPVPVIGPAEILVRIRASGICGSDVMEWYRMPKAPLVLGHEVAGDIVEVGEDATHLAVGQRVVVSHHVPCNTCELCLNDAHTACHTLHTTNFDPGGFSEFVRVPALQTERGVLVLPDAVSYEEGTFVEPLGCVVRAQERAGVRPGSTVLVVGSGISGLLHIRLAFALGAGRVVATDVSDYRLDFARRSGAIAFDAAEAGAGLPDMVRDVNDGRLADLVILCTSALPAIAQGMASLESGATFMLLRAAAARRTAGPADDRALAARGHRPHILRSGAGRPGDRPAPHRRPEGRGRRPGHASPPAGRAGTRVRARGRRGRVGQGRR